MLGNLKFKPSGKLVITLLIITNIVYAIMLSYTIPTLMDYSSGLAIFDMSPMGYSFEQALGLLHALGATGREFYLYQLALDLFYPALFGASYSVLMLWILNRSNLATNVWLWISILPIFAALFDYAENIGIWFMLSSYPDLPESLVSIASLLTVIKSALVTSYWVALLVLIVMVFVRKFRRSA